MKNFLKEFKDFIATGNMVELAVGVILGASVGAVIKAFTDGVMMNLIAAIVGKPTFNDVLRIKLNSKVTNGPDGKPISNGTYLEFGTVITAVVTLLLTGLVLFLIIKAYNKVRRPKAVAEAPSGPTELELLAEIRDALKARS
jgi:large conductance mechanosensitive channel